jgi:hypothetical protein
MILTTNDNFNRQEGRDLPMFSRTGKSTTSQYIVFAQPGGKYDHVGGSIKEQKEQEEDEFNEE